MIYLRRFKRIISLFLTAALCVGMIPAVFAATGTTAEAAGAETIDLIFLVGQSNAVGAIPTRTTPSTFDQARDEAVLCEKNTIFSSFVPLYTLNECSYIAGESSLVDCTSASDVKNYISKSVGSATSLGNTSLIYKPYALSEEGNGKTGMDGAIAYEWNQLSGNDVWIVNLANYGQEISTFIPGTTYYNIISETMSDVIGVVNDDSNYEIGDIVMFWMQGESDNDTSESAYTSAFTSIIAGLNSVCNNKLKTGIIYPRCMETVSDIFMDNGAKTALRKAAEAATGTFANVYMASDVNKDWQTNSDVKAYFEEKYPDGITYPLHGKNATLSVPTTYSETFGSNHFTQVGHNENGLTAAVGLYEALYGHEYEKLEFVWSSDYTSCDAVFTCTICGESVTVPCAIEVTTTTEATCTDDGVKTITATAADPETGEKYSNDVTEDIPATGHVFDGNLIWNWSSDHKSATASYVCGKCGETITVDADIVLTSFSECTCTDDGSETYTATVVIDGEVYTDSYTEDIPALGHDLSATFEWSSDGTSCKAHIVCSRGDLDTTVDCEVVETARTDATCTEDGTVTRIASIGYDGYQFTSEPNTVTTDQALGHSYGEPAFDWSDYDSCKATFTCVRGDDSFSLNCGITSEVKQEAECASAGERVYTATVEYDGQSYSEDKSETIPATGHNYVKETYNATCGEDGYTVYICSKCGEEEPNSRTVIPATGDHTWGKGIYASANDEPSCTKSGIMTYTCTECGATKTETIPALGHEYEPEITWSNDYQSATLAITCKRNNDYNAVYGLAVGNGITATVVKEATCETVGQTQYVASYSGDEGDFSQKVIVSDIPATDHKYIYDLKSFIFIDENGNSWQYGESDNNFAWDKDGVSCVCTFVCENCGKEYTADCDVHTVSGYTQELRYATDFIVYVGDNRLLSVRTMDGHVVSVDLSPQTLSGADIGDMAAEKANEELGTVLSVDTTDNLDKGLTIEEAEIAGEAAGADENGTVAGANGTVATEGAKTGDSAWLIAGLFAAGLAGMAETLNIVARKRREN